MKQLLILSLISCLMASCSTVKKTNIILIMADDVGIEGIGCYGGLSYKTPQIDKMASAGVRYTNAHSQPLCTNTRIQLMTGLYNHRNWKYFGILDPKEKTIGHYMQDAGYKTCMAGKWQLQSYDPPEYPGSEKRRGTGMHPKDAGFDEYSLFHSLHTEDKGSRYAKPTYLENGKLISKSIDEYGPDMWVDYINGFVDRSAAEDEPFFVYYAMALPHNPFVMSPHSKNWQDKAGRMVQGNENFKDMVEYMDYCVGRIIDHIDSKGLGEDTMIIFYSDNGTNKKITSKTINGMVRGDKGGTTNAGTHVPLVVRWTGHVKAGISGALTDSTDLLPTVAEVGGTPITRKIDGVSIYPNLKDVNQKIKDNLYFFYDPRPGWDKDQFSRHVYAIDKRYKLYENGQLFDYKKDRLEQQSILLSQDTEGTKSVRKKLQKVLESMKTPL